MFVALGRHPLGQIFVLGKEKWCVARSGDLEEASPEMPLLLAKCRCCHYPVLNSTTSGRQLNSEFPTPGSDIHNGQTGDAHFFKPGGNLLFMGRRRG